MDSDVVGKSSPDDEMPWITLEAPPRRLVGFPYIVAITYENRSRSREFYRLPDLSLDFTQGPIGLSMIPVGGQPAHRIQASFGSFEPEGANAMADLMPGEKRTMVLDLANLGISPHAGAYTMTVTLQRQSIRESNSVRVDVVAPSPHDAAEAARLRKLASSSTDTGSWAEFLDAAPWPIRPPPSFSPEAAKAAAVHLFIHDAVHRKAPLATVDLARLDALNEPSLATQIAALKYEVLVAKRDPNAKATRDALTRRYPGIKHRLDKVDAGQGDLALGRSVSGSKD